MFSFPRRRPYIVGRESSSVPFLVHAHGLVRCGAICKLVPWRPQEVDDLLAKRDEAYLSLLGDAEVVSACPPEGGPGGTRVQPAAGAVRFWALRAPLTNPPCPLCAPAVHGIGRRAPPGAHPEGQGPGSPRPTRPRAALGRISSRRMRMRPALRGRAARRSPTCWAALASRTYLEAGKMGNKLASAAVQPRAAIGESLGIYTIV